MPSFNTISPDKLVRLVGTPKCPTIVDVRDNPQRLLPSSLLRAGSAPGHWLSALGGGPIVVVCDDGRQASGSVAAWLRSEGREAEVLEGGFSAWIGAGLPTIDAHVLPKRDGDGRTLWVTRARPKVDRIACPWLIRRFIDPSARILYVAPSDVLAAADALGALAFDTDGARWSDREGRCTFDAMVEDFGLEHFPALLTLADIVRGADTNQLDQAPQAAGLLAMSLGLSRMHADDHEQLNDGMILYDAFYRWCRDAVDESHDAGSHGAGRGPRKS